MSKVSRLASVICMEGLCWIKEISPTRLRKLLWSFKSTTKWQVNGICCPWARVLWFFFFFVWGFKIGMGIKNCEFESCPSSLRIDEGFQCAHRGRHIRKYGYNYYRWPLCTTTIFYEFFATMYDYWFAFKAGDAYEWLPYFYDFCSSPAQNTRALQPFQLYLCVS